jgi:hypothetical protein
MKSSVPIMQPAEESHLTMRIPTEYVKLGMAAPYRNRGVNRIGLTPPYQVATEGVFGYLQEWLPCVPGVVDDTTSAVCTMPLENRQIGVSLKLHAP